MAKPDSEKLIQHLKAKWQGRSCPMCNHGNWSVQDTVFELRPFHGGSMVIGSGPLVPVIPVTCNNCGNTVLLNAIITGAIDRQEGGHE